MPHAVVIRAPGTNCDQELCRGYAQAGATVELVHLESLVRDPSPLAKADLLGIPGGFSYGDDIASGRIFAMKVRERLYSPLREAIARGVPVFAPCNGFQVAVQVGLLPGPARGEEWPTDAPPTQELALTDNIGGRFVDRWVPVDYPTDSACIWTRGVLDDIPEAFRNDAAILPVAHGEGRLVSGDPATLARMQAGGQVAIRYLDNYNGSTEAIAGVSDASGRIFGLMPHPERFLEWTRHPYWTRLPKDLLKVPTPGARMFMNAVEAVSGAWVR
jgi:phosphoribosylformylglycinamidine synthase